MSSLNWQAWSSLCSMIGSGGGRWDAPLKSTVRAQNTIKLNCAMNDSFFLFYFFIADFFWCLRRSGFVVGDHENALGARQNFLYAGKTLLVVCLNLFSPPISLHHLSRSAFLDQTSCHNIKKSSANAQPFTFTSDG